MSVEVGGGVKGAQTFVVALADLGKDVYPVPCLHTVVSLDIECTLWLDDLEHLQENRKEEEHNSNHIDGLNWFLTRK